MEHNDYDDGDDDDDSHTSWTINLQNLVVCMCAGARERTKRNINREIDRVYMYFSKVQIVTHGSSRTNLRDRSSAR